MKLKPYLLIIMISIIFSVQTLSCNEWNELEIAKLRALYVFEVVKDAEARGCDVSELVQKLNAVLDDIRSAEYLYHKGRVDEAKLRIDKALTALDEIEAEAKNLRSSMLITVISTPWFILSVIFLVIFLLWLVFQLVWRKGIYGMRVKYHGKK